MAKCRRIAEDELSAVNESVSGILLSVGKVRSIQPLYAGRLHIHAGRPNKNLLLPARTRTRLRRERAAAEIQGR